LCENEVVDPKRVRLIRGSGVDTSIYAYKPQLDGTPVVLLASRMLWDKGVGEFVEAAGILKKEGVTARFVLAGESDQENPGSISSEQLREWDRDGDIEWWGKCNEMPKIFNQVHIVCLPTTYGEGVPKVLIEAASCGRPIVATDAPGCREIVVDGENGLLVPAKNMDALVDAIRGLLESSALRERMGLAGRERVKREFSIEKVAADTLNVYELIGR
tara:strand:- start:20412 stop:21059 length:648 start_codon:yes stop_codon:yes gene_type:complete